MTSADMIDNPSIPHSPRRSARSPTPTDPRSNSAGSEVHGEASTVNEVADSGIILSPACTAHGTPNSTTTVTPEHRPTLARGVKHISLSSPTLEDSAQSKSETAVRETEPQETPTGSAPGRDMVPLTPSPSIDSSDIPLPSVEVDDSQESGRTHDSVSVSSRSLSQETDDSESGHTSVPESRVSGTPEPSDGKLQASLATGLADLSLSSPTSERSSLAPLPGGLHVPADETKDPVTVRSLLRATPMPSPAPDTGKEVTADEDERDAKHSLSSIASEKIVNAKGQSGLIGTVDDSDSDDSDFSDGFDGLQVVDQYDVRSVEPLPPSPFSNPAFQQSLKSGIDLAKEILIYLDSCELAAKSETQLHRLRERALSLSSFDYPAKRRIGIVGDSGAGKSSLINSLLHLPDLAHRGDHGSAVTSFVTEYRNRKADQTAPFTIKVKCAERSHLKDQISELVFDVRTLTDPGIVDDISDSEFRAFERRSAVALSTLESIFPGKHECTKAYLEDRTDESSSEKITARLCELADQIVFPEGAETGEWLETAASASECRQKIMHFMDNGFWPLINKVKVYLSAQVLKTGIILADLPGFRDINLARVKKAETYQHKCDEIFIVANIKRVVSDKSVRDLMTGEFSNPRPNTTVSIICTHADEINLADWTGNRDLRRLVDQARLQDIRREMRSATLKRQADRLEKAKIEYKYLFVALRNQRIQREIHDKYASLVTGNASLKVFCIGNKDYEGHDIDYQEARDLAIRGSGVPELRDFCHSVVAKAQFRASNHFIETQIPDLIQSLKLWIEAAGDDPGPVIPANVLPDLQESLLGCVEAFSTGIEGHLTSQILQPFKKSQNDYDRCAIEAGKEWTTWHHASFKAFMRQNGTYSTQAVGSRNMNQELIEYMNIDLTEQWKALSDLLDQMTDVLQQDLEVLMKRMIRDMAATPTLLNFIRLKDREMKYRMQEERTKLTDAYSLIQHNATGDHWNSYILTTMLPTYRSCASESGPGMKARMLDTMRRKLTRRDIFTFIYNQINHETTRIFGETNDRITDLLIEMCADMERQVKMIRGPESEASAMGEAGLERIRSVVLAAREKMHALSDQSVPARLEAVAKGWIDR